MGPVQTHLGRFKIELVQLIFWLISYIDNISTTVSRQVLIYTAEGTGAMRGELNCPSFKAIARRSININTTNTNIPTYLLLAK